MTRRRSRLVVVLLGACGALASAFARGGGDDKTPLWQLVEKVAEKRGFAKELAALVEHQQTMVSASAVTLHPYRRVTTALSKPWTVPEIARELQSGLRGGFDARVMTAARFLDLDLVLVPNPQTVVDEGLTKVDQIWWKIVGMATDGPSMFPPPEGRELLDFLSGYLRDCGKALDGALERLDDDERKVLRERFPEFAALWAAYNDPKSHVSQEQWVFGEKYKALSRKVDRARVLAVAARVARLTDPKFLKTLPERLAKTPRSTDPVDGFSGDVVTSVGAEPGEARVVLLGRGKTTITGSAALVIDLGGDDVWKRAAVATDATTPISVVIDLGGDDRYESEGPGPCCSAAGIALLHDAKGKDRYTSRRFGQAATAVGFAELSDRDGDDVYSAEDYAQGFSFCGTALLLDGNGNDSYDAWAFAQGAGLGNGFAACVDGGGNDKYVANGHWPDVYGDSGPGSFQGVSQGYSTGIRQLRSDNVAEVEIPGGFAALVDLGDGKDFYDSGNFSQGGAYFFGFGLMYDGGGDDVNHGYRYSQGFGVHQAAGMRWDAGGNDVYVTKCAANCGAAWDEGVGFFVDDSGNDQYDVGGLALGGAAETAIAIFIDGGGNDRYGGGGGNDSQGGSGAGDYHEKEGVPQSLGVLIDLGGGVDTFTRPDRDVATIATGDHYGIFVHAKEKDLAALLSGSALQKALDAKPVPKSDKPAKPKH
ncbi:MAG TPA: hypothetical protein VFG37_04050 [Planctomycetota bacterium]|jgi:hypothetical protein|nr:hypothetical protein [Planctomycetota bacterium]